MTSVPYHLLDGPLNAADVNLWNTWSDKEGINHLLYLNELPLCSSSFSPNRLEIRNLMTVDTIFKHQDIRNVRFSNSMFYDVCMNEWRMYNVDFKNATHLYNLQANNLMMEFIDFSYSSRLENSEIQYGKFVECGLYCDIVSCNFAHSHMKDSELSSNRITNTNFEHSRFKTCAIGGAGMTKDSEPKQIIDAKFNRCVFDESYIENVDFINCSFNSTSFKDIQLLRNVTFMNCDLRSFKFHLLASTIDIEFNSHCLVNDYTTSWVRDMVLNQ